MIRFTTAYYGLTRAGQWVATLVQEWVNPENGSRGHSEDDRIPCPDEATAKAKAYAMGADSVRCLA